MRLSYHSIRQMYQTYVGISILYVNPPHQPDILLY